jgi:hypothetical protein
MSTKSVNSLVMDQVRIEDKQMTEQTNSTIARPQLGWLFAIVLIMALGSAESSAQQTFADVPPEYWAFQYVESLAASGITGGCGGGNYCPGNNVSRAQMAVFLERGMRGSSFVPPPATGVLFADVGAADFAAAYIEQLAADGVTGGCGGGNYCPNSNVTRAQMAVFLLRAKYGSFYDPPAATGVFLDVPVGSFADKWIEQLALEGITGGCGGGNYCPNDPVARDQMAVFLVRAFSLPIVLPSFSLIWDQGNWDEAEWQ